MTELNKVREELKELRKNNRDAWNVYGSELCAGDMIGQERLLEEQIARAELKELNKSYDKVK
ncbi:hypothetical protein LCGC14_1740360 [marine sediment metagenome]|uniref:Uncharacterized protein n=1 Tax=marine sediment metagenome TaxID=412755 RepID=A0A0F9H6V9_9ZZZZ